MKPLNNICIRWLQCCLIFFVAGCISEAKQKTISPVDLEKNAFVQRAFIQIGEAKKLIKDGDILTRLGNDFTSKSLKKLNRRDETWSHCGIASFEKDSLFIYHSLGGEWNPDEKIKRDLFEAFSEPFSNNGIGIYRFDISESLVKKIPITASAFKNAGVSFDMDFNLQTDNKMYCAEFVCRVLEKASGKRLVFHHSFINKFEFIGVDDIFLQPQCRHVKTYLYK